MHRQELEQLLHFIRLQQSREVESDGTHQRLLLGLIATPAVLLIALDYSVNPFDVDLDTFWPGEVD